MIIDTHAHIDQMQDVEGGLARAAEAGVSDIVAVGMNLESNKKLLEIQHKILNAKSEKLNKSEVHNSNDQNDCHAEELCDEASRLRDPSPAQRDQDDTTFFSNLDIRYSDFPNIHVGLGLHPSDVLKEVPTETMAFVREHIASVTCVGEVGLDYQYKEFYQNETAQNVQRDAFAQALAIAKEFDKPIVIHSRNAEADCLRMTKEAGIKNALFHWYSGPVEIMEKVLAEGYYVSTSPAVGFSGFSRKAMKYAPVERILIETDTPVFYRNKDKSESFRAEPKDVWRTLKALAEWKQMDEDELLAIVNGNARRFFRIELS